MTRLPSHAGLFCFARAVSGLPALLQVGSLCIGAGNGALGQAVCLPRCGLACPIACFRAPVRLAGVRFHSDTTFCKRYADCKVTVSL